MHSDMPDEDVPAPSCSRALALLWPLSSAMGLLFPEDAAGKGTSTSQRKALVKSAPVSSMVYRCIDFLVR